MQPIKKILIANRGEIALRIMRAAKELGISTSTVYSAVDLNHSWTSPYNDSWSLGEGTLAETYLNIEKIIDLALRAGADAIHPGYGFLSENPLFAEACKANELTFIGPSPQILRLAGDKQSAHEWVKKLGIPVIENISFSSGDLIGNIRYPVIVKSASGGGGKGMRKAFNDKELFHALKTASHEALQYFGNDTVFIEEYIDHARHIEVQILGDHDGNLVHLYERECSIQRRHQKLIEETPAHIQDIVKSELIRASLEIGRSMQYFSAGTIEFLVDEKGNYFFLEMNPRIQVEHGITELVTGIDIVKEQIRIAEGRTLSFKQENILQRGHAIEVRICAEDSEDNLVPSPGTIQLFHIPDAPGMRLETAAGDDTPVLPDFDPLVAKVMTHASSRSQAISDMQKVLGKMAITGIRHNTSLLSIVLAKPEFLQNNISTQFLEDSLPLISEEITMVRKLSELKILIGAAIMMLTKKHEGNSPWVGGYWRNIRQLRFRKDAHIAELEYEFKGEDAIDFYYRDATIHTTAVNRDDKKLHFNLDEQPVILYQLLDQPGIISISDGHLEYSMDLFTARKQEYYDQEADHSETHGDTVVAPQPGTIMNIKVSEGQKVNRGDYLLTIESMKLENTILALRQGYIKKITIKPGDRVKKNEPLIFLQETLNN